MFLVVKIEGRSSAPMGQTRLESLNSGTFKAGLETRRPGYRGIGGGMGGRFSKALKEGSLRIARKRGRNVAAQKRGNIPVRIEVERQGFK